MINFKPSFLFCFLVFLVACGAVPKSNDEITQQITEYQISGSEWEVLDRNPPRITLHQGQVDFSFSKNSPLIKTDFGPSAAATVRFVNEGSGKYLIVWSWLAKGSSAKIDVVFPKLSVFDSQKNLIKIKLVQNGEEAACGIFRCRKMVYDIGELQNGTYQLVLVATVEDQSFVYADYFGDLRVSLESTLPFP